MPDPTTSHLLSDLLAATRDMTVLAKQFEAALVNLRAAYEALPPGVTDPIIGIARSTYNADLLTDAQMKEIDDSLRRGDEVQACLYYDRWKSGSRIARITQVTGETMKAVLWGDDEIAQQFALLEPRKQIWWYRICPKVSGV